MKENVTCIHFKTLFWLTELTSLSLKKHILTCSKIINGKQIYLQINHWYFYSMIWFLVSNFFKKIPPGWCHSECFFLPKAHLWFLHYHHLLESNRAIDSYQILFSFILTRTSVTLSWNFWHYSPSIHNETYTLTSLHIFINSQD